MVQYLDSTGAGNGVSNLFVARGVRAFSYVIACLTRPDIRLIFTWRGYNEGTKSIRHGEKGNKDAVQETIPCCLAYSRFPLSLARPSLLPG